MKTKNVFLVLLFVLLYSLTSVSAQTSDSTMATEWIAIKESSIDSLTLNYLNQKGLISYVAPKEENNGVFVNVVSYLAKLLNSSLSSISKNTNKFYNTPLGFWVVWGTFYHYTGGEILKYLLIFFYLVVITGFFIWLWCKNCIHKIMPVEKTSEEEIAEEQKPTTDTINYEVKKSSVNMQFWLLLVYLVLFLIGAGTL